MTAGISAPAVEVDEDDKEMGSEETSSGTGPWVRSSLE